MSTYKWCQLSMKFVIWILKTLLGQSIILLLPLPQVSDITSVVEVVVKLILQSEPLYGLIIRGKVIQFALSIKSFPVFFSQLFVRTEGVHFVPSMLHEPSLVGPPSMRDAIHSYLLPLLLQLFRIFSICLNRVFKEFILFIFGQVIESLQG
jgi:hypothetical protein